MNMKERLKKAHGEIGTAQKRAHVAEQGQGRAEIDKAEGIRLLHKLLRNPFSRRARKDVKDYFNKHSDLEGLDLVNA